MKRVILDVDTGNDDAVAIMMAALHPSLDVVGCTSVAGNLPVEHTTDNTLRVLDHIGRHDVPVFRGLAKPIAPPPFPHQPGFVSSATAVHQQRLELTPTTRRAGDATAVEWLVETLRATTDRLTLIPTGPLTNIAAALTLAPEIAPAIGEIVIMGGSATHGNETSQAEFNAYCDPIAAHIVFHAGLERLVLVPLDATRQARVTATQLDDIAAIGTPAALATARIMDYYLRGQGTDEAHVHDALCVAYVIDAAVLELERVRVDCDTTGYRTYGRTLIDRYGVERREPNAFVAFGADSGRFLALLHESLARVAAPRAGTPPAGPAGEEAPRVSVPEDRP